MPDGSLSNAAHNARALLAQLRSERRRVLEELDYGPGTLKPGRLQALEEQLFRTNALIRAVKEVEEDERERRLPQGA